MSVHGKKEIKHRNNLVFFLTLSISIHKPLTDNLIRFFLMRRDVQSRCFSVIVYTRNRHQPRDTQHYRRQFSYIYFYLKFSIVLSVQDFSIQSSRD